MSDELWFRFHPSKFMAGIRGLNANEVKAYICILCRIYESNGPVRSDHEILSTYCEMRPSSFAKALDRLVRLEKLILTDDGRLTNLAAEREISHRASKSQNSARAAKISHEKRQQNQCSDPAQAMRPLANIREEKRREERSTPPPDVGSRSPRESSDQPIDAAGVDAAKRILDAAGFDLSKDVTGRFMGSGPRDQVAAWLGLGLALSEIEHIVRVVAEQYRARGDPAISLRAFDAHIRRAAARKAEPVNAPPPPAAGEPRKSAVERFLEKQADDEKRADRGVPEQDHEPAVASAAASGGR
jgi:uncharacterized protein YdaU (DUF1376 family)